MADYSAVSDVENRRCEFTRMLAEVRIVVPAEITAVTTGPLRVNAQPLTMLKKTLGKEVSYIALPVIENVPVMLPYAQGTGLMLTLPLQVGDVGLLLVSDTALDVVLSTPGVAAPPIYGNPAYCTPRAHDLTDAIFIPGMVTDYFDIPSYQLGSIELRDKSRTTYISLNSSGITMTDGQAVMKISGGKVETTAPSGISNSTDADISNTASGLMKIQSQNFNTGQNGASGESTITGSLKSSEGTFTDKDGKVLGSHTHNYTDDGSSMVTAGPNAG